MLPPLRSPAGLSLISITNYATSPSRLRVLQHSSWHMPGDGPMHCRRATTSTTQTFESTPVDGEQRHEAFRGDPLTPKLHSGDRSHGRGNGNNTLRCSRRRTIRPHRHVSTDQGPQSHWGGPHPSRASSGPLLRFKRVRPDDPHHHHNRYPHTVLGRHQLHGDHIPAV